MNQGYRSWFQDLINVLTMLATMLKNKVMHRQSFTCRFCKFKMLYMFKTFVSLLSRHTSYLTHVNSRHRMRFNPRSNY